MPNSHDVETGAVAGERTPMLEGSQDNHTKEEGWSIMSFLQFFGGGIYAPDPSTYDPIEILLNSEDGQDRDDLTVKWRDNKLSELNFVGIVVSS